MAHNLEIVLAGIVHTMGIVHYGLALAVLLWTWQLEKQKRLKQAVSTVEE